MRMRYKAAVGAVAIMATSLIGLTPGSAMAEPDGKSPKAVRVESTMETVAVVSVDTAGAQHVLRLANGNEVRLSAEQYRKWSKTEYGAKVTKGDVSAANELLGRCGSQYLYIDGMGALTLQVSTGFNLIAAVAYSATWVDIYDEGGSSERFYGTGFDDGYWSTKELLGGMTEGYAFAQIDTASYAVLATGFVCTALGASDDAWIYY